MANKLEKQTRIQHIPGSPGTPGSPGVPGTPAHYISVPYTMHNVAPTGIPPGYHFERSTGSGAPRMVLVSNDGLGHILTAGAGTAGHGMLLTRQVLVPASGGRPATTGTPKVPSQTLYDFNIGWNSGARSRAVLRSSGYISFKAPITAIGIFAGLNHSKTDDGYASMSHAWSLSNGIAKIYERGVMVANIGAFAHADTFKIVRRGDPWYDYLINDVVVYTSEDTDLSSVFMDVSMYSGGDYIFDPEMGDLSYAESRSGFSPLDGFAADHATNESFSGFLPLTGTARVGIWVRTQLQPLTGLASDHAYAESRGLFAPLTGAAESLLTPTYAIGYGEFVSLTGISYGRHGANARVIDAAFLPLIGLSADHSYAESHSGFSPLEGYSEQFEAADEATLFTPIFGIDLLDTAYTIVVIMNSQGTVTTAMVVSEILPANMDELGLFSTTWNIDQALVALMTSVVQAGFYIPLFADAMSVWVVNAKSHGTTRYDNYDFNSYAQIDGHYYGMKQDGLYLLEGDDDASLPIRAMISYGKRDFNSPKLKHLANAYIGVSSSGQMILKVIVNGVEHLYTARNFSTELSTRRFDIGKGLRANVFELELYNSNGADFELSTVEFMPAIIERRI